MLRARKRRAGQCRPGRLRHRKHLQFRDKKTSTGRTDQMNDSSNNEEGRPGGDARPILIVPYMWIGDFVRGHSVVRLLRARFPDSPIDVLTTTVDAPLLDYMPGVRKGIVWDLPRKRLALARHRALADRLRPENYGRALVMPRTWKSALAPWLAGIPVRTGFAGERRFVLLHDVRWGERALPRMVDRCVALALPKGAVLPSEYPLPQLVVPEAEIAAWRQRLGLAAAGRVAAFAPGAVGPSKRWPAGY